MGAHCESVAIMSSTLGEECYMSAFDESCVILLWVLYKYINTIRLFVVFMVFYSG